MTHIVETTNGKIEGFEKNNVSIFLGIPFASPPTGKQRWLPPEPVVPWRGVKETKSFVAMAPQKIAPLNPSSPFQVSPRIDLSIGRQPPVNEDCLHLNIYTPGTDKARRPVMIWIHGGAFATGTGASPLSNGTVLASRGDVVVVTINYRLNIFGFLRLNDVTNGLIPSTGNEGILDQLAALKWVRNNIEAFGGNPNNITIFGLSAGAASVCALLGMKAAKGLFNKAISQSGSADFLNDRDEANGYSEYFLYLLGVKGSDVSALQELKMERLLETYVRAMSLPKGIRSPTVTIDGEIFKEMPILSIKAGSADGIPLLAGTAADEWRTWQATDPAIANLVEGRMIGRFNRMMPGWDITNLVKEYGTLLSKRGIAPTPTEIYLAIMTARMFWIPTTRVLETQAKRGNPAYSYMFTWKAAFLNGMFGAFHGIDSGFLWNTYNPAVVGTSPMVETLSHSMQDAWISFARTGNPGCPALGKWPTYGEQRETMLLGEQIRIEQALLEEERLIWKSVPDNIFKWG